MVLDMTLRDIERVLYFEAYVVTDPGMTPLNAAQHPDRRATTCAKLEEYGDDFNALMGAEGIRELLRILDLDRRGREACAANWNAPAPKPRSRRSPSA